MRGEARGDVAVFRGIPYGEARQRFLPPEPAGSWAGVLDCTRNGPISPQLGGSICNDAVFGPYFSGGDAGPFGTGGERQSENCLVLNVLTPSVSGRRPVAVYLHGGSFTSGSGSLVLGADRFVREQNVVLVGVNHRLNLFGFLYLGGFDAAYGQSGLAGLLDLVLALRWVRDNIGAFGGDPQQVTIFGESGGGMKVSALMAMPEAEGLFCRAAVISGSAAVGHLSKQQGTNLARALLRRLNIAGDDWRRLLTLPAAQLLSALPGLGEDGYEPAPVADGSLLQPQPEPVITASACSRGVPLLVGSSEEELSAFLPLEELGITPENLVSRLEQPLRLNTLCCPAVPRGQAAGVVRAAEAIGHSGDDALHTYLRVRSLSNFLGAGAWYQAMAQSALRGAPVYHYVTRYDSPHPARPSLHYAWHTADLPLALRLVLHPECDAFSRRLSRQLGAFFRTGSPSPPDCVWPAFTPEDRSTMVLDEPCHVERDPLGTLRAALEQAGFSLQCDEPETPAAD